MRPQDRAAVIVMAAITMVLLAGCTADNRTATPSTRPPSSRAVATPTAGACTTGQVRDLVNQFVHAFNVGDQRALQQLWAQQGDGFDWYSTDAPGQRILSAAEDRVGLVHYFTARHAARESLRLTSFQFNGNSAAYGNFQYTLIRRANDLTATAYTGKGAAICAPTRSTLGVWSMAKDPRSRATTPPPSGTPQATNTFHTMGAHVTEVSYLEKFITAYNAGDLLAAPAQFSPTQPVAFSDCDYATQQLGDGHWRYSQRFQIGG